MYCIVGAETFSRYETMHLKIIAVILCLSLVLVQAGDYRREYPKSAILKHIQPSRVVVIHHHNGKRGSGSNSNSGNKKGRSNRNKKGGSSGSGEKKKRYRRSVESLGSSGSLED